MKSLLQSILLLLVYTQFFILSLSQANTPLQLNYEEKDPNLIIDLKKLFRVPDPKYRLYPSIIPTHYDLKIRPILDNVPEVGKQWTAPGTVVIYINCVENTNNISLHSGVEINESSVKVSFQSNGTEILNPTFSRDTQKEFFITSFDEPLIANEKYIISMDFIAQVFTGLNQLSGLYRSHYIDPVTKNTKYLATTQFQAFGARLAFPCFDEPEYKATFNTTIGRIENQYTTVSNTRIINTTKDEQHTEWVWDIFEQTVPMPTYLVAMVISDYTAAKAPPELYGKPVQTIGPKHFIDTGLGDYTAKVAAIHLSFFEDYFIEKYSLAKMDSAAMVDFSAGAMENWGLNIYREAYLIYSKKENTENERRGISSVLAHELAHQWFGNLITCKWWIDAWVNEGFASYLQFLGMNNATPEFEPMKVRLIESFQPAMRSDVLENSHPTRLPDKGSPYDTMNYLSALVYSKGSAIIRMMEGFLDYTTLQIGLQKFLKKYSFKPADQDELFDVLNEQAHLDKKISEDTTIKQIMDTWTLQRGYPLVKVTTAGSNRIFISQEKFVNKGKIPENFQWYIPVAVATQDNPNFTHAIPEFWIKPSTIFTNREHDTKKWILLNAGATGYYRVIYDKQLTTLILNQLNQNHSIIGHGSRSQLIDDYFTAGYEGYTDIEQALEFTKYFAKELEYTVWVPVLYHLRKMYNLYNIDDFTQLGKYLEPRISQVLSEIGLEQNDTDFGNVVLFRAQLLDWACGLQYKSCLDYAARLWNDWKATPTDNKIPIDLRQIIYCAAIRAGDSQDDIDFALDQYTAEDTTSAFPLKQKPWLINALGCILPEHLLESLLDKSIDENSKILKTDATTLVRSIAGNINGRTLALKFLETNIDTILAYMGDANLISGVISTLSNYYNNDTELNRVKSFVDSNANKLGDVMSSLNTSISNIEANIKWVKDNYEKTQQWFWSNI